MNCPKCGAAIPEGMAYCSNPACGAVPGPQPSAAGCIMRKEMNTKLNFNFVKLARVAAVSIILLAAAYLYFFARTGR